MKRSLSMGREDRSSMEMITMMNMLPAMTSRLSSFLSHWRFVFIEGEFYVLCLFFCLE